MGIGYELEDLAWLTYETLRREFELVGVHNLQDRKIHLHGVATGYEPLNLVLLCNYG